MPLSAEIREAFPAVDDVTDDSLREGVIEAWRLSLAETGWQLSEVPWFPPVQEDLGIPDELLVDHVNEVVEIARSAAETLRAGRGDVVSVDLVLAGALVHDVSKLYEFDEDGATDVQELLGHPHYGLAIVDRVGLPATVSHVVLSHTRRTAVEPATLEAAIVRRADEIAADAIRARALDDLRER
ncbi:MAG: HD domain-containing protein [Natrialbaceae archaeon]